MTLSKLPLSGLIVDVAMLLAVQLSFGWPDPIRLALATLALEALTLALRLLLPNAPLLKAACLLACFPVSAVLLRHRNGRRVIEASVAMAAISAVCAGLAMLVSNAGAPPWLPALGALAAAALLRWRRSRRVHWQIDVSVEKNGVLERFPALIDTGNRLREHRSGMPVLIVESCAIPALASLARRLPNAETRCLPFGVLGGSGQMRCFFPDRVRLALPDGREHSAPPCWIAPFDGTIPGRTHALAPAEFAEYSRYGAVNNTENEPRRSL